MSSIALNPTTGDILVENNKGSLTTGVQATKQRLTSKLRFFLGEWFLDKTEGVPYIQQILIKNPNPVIVDAVLKREIITDPAVIKLTKFQIDVNTSARNVQLDFSALTKDGPVNLSVSLP